MTVSYCTIAQRGVCFLRVMSVGRRPEREAPGCRVWAPAYLPVYQAASRATKQLWLTFNHIGANDSRNHGTSQSPPLPTLHRGAPLITMAKGLGPSGGSHRSVGAEKLEDPLAHVVGRLLRGVNVVVDRGVQALWQIPGGGGGVGAIMSNGGPEALTS